MKELSNLLIEMAMAHGAAAAGISTVDTLKDGPESTDLTYILPGAKSALTFAMPLDAGLIDPYLSKKDHGSLERNIFQVEFLSSGIAMFIASYLELKKIPSVAVAANLNYRKDTPLDGLDMMPTLSHRYLAARSGVGSFGLSGNIITQEAGAAVLLCSVVTAAELVPTDPIPEEENYCDGCGSTLRLRSVTCPLLRRCEPVPVSEERALKQNYSSGQSVSFETFTS
ncbi:MAG: epoxyqueuosine reductase [bacterium]|nr:epoxyqueuosine reductase [bacterium]